MFGIIFAADKATHGSNLWTSPLFWAFLITVAALLLVLLLRKLAARILGIAKTHGLLVGTDNRLSTSKFMAFLWTVVVFYMLTSMALIYRAHPTQFVAHVNGFDNLYLVLLGGPFAAAVLAKAIVSNAVDSGKAQKSQANTPSVFDVFSDDDGNADLVDIQYLLFNLLAASIVIGQFVGESDHIAPIIPGFLAALTGASAATYLLNKVASPSSPSPTIARISPPVGKVGDELQAIGSYFLAQGDNGAPTVTVDSRIATVNAARSSASLVVFTIPAGVGPGERPVIIRSPAGADSPALTITVKK